jgi:predicted GIY-YIG superfamily endonuclease
MSLKSLPLSIELSKLPSLPLASRKDLPGCPAIYFVLDGDRILYIGKANNLWQRWTTHHRFKQLSTMDISLSIAWLECEDTSTLNTLEKQLIAALHPELNNKEIWREMPSAKVMFTCEHEFKDDLSEWAKSERRTVSNLVEGIVTDALTKWKQENTKTA